MSTAFVECWKCDLCGFRWIKTEIWPERCASSKCRSRRWNGSQVQPVKAKPAILPTASLPARTDNPIQFFKINPPVDATKPNMEALRNICAGNVKTVAPEPDVSVERPMCCIEWWEDGEHYVCLMDKGHKSVKHGLHGMVRTLDQ